MNKDKQAGVLQKAQKTIEQIINGTPTGTYRNELCDLNIELLEAIHETSQPLTVVGEESELVKTFEEYIELLDKELSKMATIAYVHGYKSNLAEIDEGVRLRAKIEQLKSTPTLVISIEQAAEERLHEIILKHFGAINTAHPVVGYDWEDIINAMKEFATWQHNNPQPLTPYGYIFENRFYKYIETLSGQTFTEGNEPVEVFVKGKHSFKSNEKFENEVKEIYKEETVSPEDIAYKYHCHAGVEGDLEMYLTFDNAIAAMKEYASLNCKK